jgi:hypothetical protein
MRPRRKLGLVALVALCVAVAGFSGANFAASSTNPGSTFSAANDFVAPVVTLTAPADGGLVNDATPTFGGAAGTAPGDSSTVTVKIYGGASAMGAPVQTRTATQSGGAWSVDGAPALPDGTYTARAEQSDAGANTGLSAPTTFTIDASAPGVTLTSPANGALTSNPTPAYSGAAATAAGDSDTVTVRIYSGPTTGGAPVQTRTVTQSGGAWSVAGSPSLPDGVYTAQAEQSDSAGNTGTSGANTFTVKTVGPTVTLTSPADGSFTSNTKPTFSGAAGNGLNDAPTVTVKIYSGTGTGGALAQTLTTTQSGGTWSVAPSSNLPDGTYTARAEQNDVLGNQGTSSAATFTVDSDAPSGLTLTSPTNGSSTNNTTPALSGAAGNASTDSQTVTVNVYSGPTATGTPVQTLNATRSGTSWSVAASPALAQGTYTARAEQTDSAGNQSTSAATTFTIDTAAPTGLTLANPANGGATNDTTPTFSGAAGNGAGDTPSVTVTVYNGSDTSGTIAQTRTTPVVGTSWSVDASPALAQGTYTAQAEQSDAAGNNTTTATDTFKVDTTTPSVPASTIAATSGGTPVGNAGFIRSGGAYRIYANVTDSLSGVSSATANVSTITTGQTVVPLTFDPTGVTFGANTYHYISAEQTANTGLSGTKSHSVIATDNAGNATSPAVNFNNSVAVDGAAPTTTTNTVASPMRGSVSLTATAADSGGAGVASVTIQRSPAGANTWTTICTATTGPTYACSFDSTGVSDAKYDFRAFATDNAGNTDASPSTQTNKLVDNTAATLTSFTVPTSPLSGAGVSLQASASDPGGANASGVQGVTFQVAPTGSGSWSNACTQDTTSPYSCSWNTTTVADGDYDFRAVVADNAGNQTISTTLTRHVDNAPSAVDVSAANGAGTTNRPDAGDVVTFKFSEPIDPTTVESGWNGALKSGITFTIARSGNKNEPVTITDGAATLNVGPYNLKANFLGGSTTSLAFPNSSIQISGSNLIVTLGGAATFSPAPPTGAYATAPGAADMTWTGSTALKDLTGHAIPASSSGDESDGDADF